MWNVELDYGMKTKRTMKVDKEMVEKKTWKEFRDAGFLWWINMILHTFGWSICIEVDDG